MNPVVFMLWLIAAAVVGALLMRENLLAKHKEELSKLRMDLDTDRRAAVRKAEAEARKAARKPKP